MDKKVKRITVTFTDGTARDIEVGYAVEYSEDGKFLVSAAGMSAMQYELMALEMAAIIVEQHHTLIAESVRARVEQEEENESNE